MITWRTMDVGRGKVEVVECFPSLDEWIGAAASSAWEKPSNRWPNFATDDATGEVVAVALFGPGGELMVTCADGRRLTFAMPESYREVAP